MEQSNREGGKAGEGQVLATPFVRNLIKQNNLDVGKIRGSGENGRILESDVQKLIKSSSSTSNSASSTPSQPKSTYTPSQRSTKSSQGSSS